MEMGKTGMLIVAFVGIIVALSFLTGSIYPTIGTMVNKVDVPITTQVEFPTNATALTLTGQAVESVVVINGTTTLGAGNYSVSNRVVSNGQLIATIVGVGTDVYAGETVNISYTYEPFGYDTNSGNRAVIQMIAIFAALAIAVVALVPALKDGILDYFS